MTILALLLLALSGYCVGAQDDELFNRKYTTSRDRRNKYAEDERGALIPAPGGWYYKLFKLKYKERFPLSATALVWLTDRWHMWKSLGQFCTRTAPVLLATDLHDMPVWQAGAAWIALWGVQGLLFHTRYTWGGTH